MSPILANFARHSAVALALLTLASCNRSCSGTFHADPGYSETDWTVNGRRTINKQRGGTARRLETTNDVVLAAGRIATFPKAAVIKLDQTENGQTRQAELRENEGKLELWVSDKGAFRRGSAADDVWLERFLSAITSP